MPAGHNNNYKNKAFCLNETCQLHLKKLCVLSCCCTAEQCAHLSVGYCSTAHLASLANCSDWHSSNRCQLQAELSSLMLLPQLLWDPVNCVCHQLLLMLTLLVAEVGC